MSSDEIDNILRQWKTVRPDLDCSAMGVIGRLRRTSNIWEKNLSTVFQLYGLSNIEFDIMATMRRSNYAITPTELYNTLMLSSGTMSTRIEKLVKCGFVQRIPSDKDRRSCKVRLTDKGIELVDTALNAHLINMDNMLSVLNHQEKDQLANLLRKILLAQ